MAWQFISPVADVNEGVHEDKTILYEAGLFAHSHCLPLSSVRVVNQHLVKLFVLSHTSCAFDIPPFLQYGQH